MALHTWQISTSPSSLPRWTRPHLAHRKDTNGSQQPWNLQWKQNRIIQWVSEIYNGYNKPLTVPVALALTSYSVSFPLDSSNSKSSVSCCSTFVWLHWLQVHSGKRKIQLYAGYKPHQNNQKYPYHRLVPRILLWPDRIAKGPSSWKPIYKWKIMAISNNNI